MLHWIRARVVAGELVLERIHPREIYLEPPETGWCEEPQMLRRGPTCARHHPVHHCDCSICRHVINQRIKLQTMQYITLESDMEQRLNTLLSEARGDRSTSALMLAAQAWQDSETAKLEINGTLAQAFARILTPFIRAVRPKLDDRNHANGATHVKRPYPVRAWQIKFDEPNPDWVKALFVAEKIDWCPSGEGLFAVLQHGTTCVPHDWYLVQDMSGTLNSCEPGLFKCCFEEIH